MYKFLLLLTIVLSAQLTSAQTDLIKGKPDSLNFGFEKVPDGKILPDSWHIMSPNAKQYEGRVDHGAGQTFYSWELPADAETISSRSPNQLKRQVRKKRNLAITNSFACKIGLKTVFMLTLFPLLIYAYGRIFISVFIHHPNNQFFYFESYLFIPENFLSFIF